MFENKKIMIVVPKRLGDAIFYTPAIAFLKKHVPSCSIDLFFLTELSKQVFKNNPAVNAGYDSLDEAPKSYDAILDFHAHGKDVSEIVSHFEGELFSGGKHEDFIPSADHALNFLANLLGVTVEASDRHYHLYPQMDAFAKVESFDLKPDSKKVVFHLGCHGASKSAWKFWRKQAHEKVWPFANFVKAAKLINQKYPNVQFILTGSKLESVLAKKFCRKIKNAVNLTCQTSVLECAALMKSMDMVLTGDTGVLHVACAMDAPLLALYGPTEIRRTGPYPLTEFCKTLQADDMSLISPEAVFEVIDQELKK